MAGSASNSVRSAYVVETVPGTINATPAFVTSDDLILMKATPILTEASSQRVGGARSGHGVEGVDTAGTREGVVIYGNDDDWIESLLQGAWSTNTLIDGKARSTLTVENSVPQGQGGAYDYHRFRGVEVTRGVYNMSARTSINRTFDLLGVGADDVTGTAVAGSTYAAPAESDILSSGQDVGSITIGALTLDCIFSLEMTLEFDGRQGQPKIQSNDLCGVTRGGFKPVLKGRMYVESSTVGTILNDSRAAHSAFAVTVAMGSITTKKYLWTFPQCHFGPATLELDQPDAFVDFEILPEYDTGISGVVQVDRAVA